MIKTIDILKMLTRNVCGCGSNGILITTKSEVVKTTVNYNGYVSVDWLGKKLDCSIPNRVPKYQYEWWTLAGEMNQYTVCLEGIIRMMDFYTGAWSDIEQLMAIAQQTGKIKFLVEVLLLKAIIYLFSPERKNSSIAFKQ